MGNMPEGLIRNVEEEEEEGEEDEEEGVEIVLMTGCSAWSAMGSYSCCIRQLL
jgi:hypothetical protein